MHVVARDAHKLRKTIKTFITFTMFDIYPSNLDIDGLFKNFVYKLLSLYVILIYLKKIIISRVCI